MEIKVNVETNAEEREDVELFEQERRKEISRRGLVTWSVNTLLKKFILI